MRLVPLGWEQWEERDICDGVASLRGMAHHSGIAKRRDVPKSVFVREAIALRFAIMHIPRHADFRQLLKYYE